MSGRDRAGQNANLFDKLLETSLWHFDGNIVAISGTFADNLQLDIDAFIDERRLPGMLSICRISQHLLNKCTQTTVRQAAIIEQDVAHPFAVNTRQRLRARQQRATPSAATSAATRGTAGGGWRYDRRRVRARARSTRRWRTAKSARSCSAE